MTKLKNIEQNSKIYKHKINILKGILGERPLEITIFFDKAGSLFQADVISETDKAYHCKVRGFTTSAYNIDKIGTPYKKIWIPKKVLISKTDNFYEIQKWFIPKMELKVDYYAKDRE